MEEELIKKLIQDGEKIDVEFKEAKEGLNKDVYDTVCSFNNRNGGHIFLGVNDNREIIGLDLNLIDKMLKEFTTSINNPQKIYPPLYLSPVLLDIDGKKLIYIFISLRDIRFVDIMVGYGIDPMKEILISQIMLNLYLSYIRESKVRIL